VSRESSRKWTRCSSGASAAKSATGAQVGLGECVWWVVVVKLLRLLASK
jgi:hypothetical protein